MLTKSELLVAAERARNYPVGNADYFIAGKPDTDHTWRAVEALRKDPALLDKG
jgi:hypothetical protein